MRTLGRRITAIVLGVPLLAGIVAEPAAAGRADAVRVETFELHNQGVSAYNRGLYAEAVEKLERCTSIALNSFRAYYYFGLALSATRQYERAVDVLTIALDLDPDDLRALVNLGTAQIKLGDVGEARAAFLRALKLREGYAPALDGLGRTYEAQAKTDEAIDFYQKSIRSNQGYAPAYTHLGDLYMELGQVREAVGLLEEAVTIRPDFAVGLTRLAVAYGRLGLHNEAVATVQKAIELDPTNPDHPHALGWIQLSQGVPATAGRSFRAALELAPDLAEARIGLAEVARRRGDYDLAAEELNRALADPELDAAMIERLLERRTKMAQEHRRVNQIYWLIVGGQAAREHYGELADILARAGQWGQAAELQRWAPPSPEQREWLAYLLFRDGRYREAYQIYEKLAAADRGGVLELNAGVALARLGNDPAAAESYHRVLEADPEARLARLYLANAQLRMGQVEAAARNYRTFLDASGGGEAAERVRRILGQIAPDLLPGKSEPLVPEPLPPRPMDRRADDGTAS